jgi:hypothetical protein
MQQAGSEEQGNKRQNFSSSSICSRTKKKANSSKNE